MTTLLNPSNTRSIQLDRCGDHVRAPGGTPVHTIRVGLLGCGTVGREVASQLASMGETWIDEKRAHIKLAGILVRDPHRERGVDQSRVVTRLDQILDARPDVIVEAIGGIEPAGDFVEAALRRGIPVVTANKTLVAHRGERLRTIARRQGAALFCEACVGGAVPILAALKQLQGDSIRSIRGIINGTCNDILTRMTCEGLTLEQSLLEARKAGLAEPDPSADISGRDSAEKLCVLAAAAGFGRITADQVETAGIESITRADIDAARSHGYVIKLVAEARLHDGHIHARVGPAMVAKHGALAGADGAQNVIIIEGGLAGPLVLKGRGAGPKPTASAILGDLHRAIRGERGTIGSASSAALTEEAPQRRFARLSEMTIRPTPQALLAAFASHGVEIRSIELRSDTAEVFTGPVRTAALKNACRSIDGRARLFHADVVEQRHIDE